MHNTIAHLPDMPHEELDQESARGGAHEQLIDEAFILAQCGDMPAAIATMEAACRCEDARDSTHEMLAQFFLEGDRPNDALLAAQHALFLGDQVSQLTESGDKTCMAVFTGNHQRRGNRRRRRHTSPLPGHTWHA